MKTRITIAALTLSALLGAGALAGCSPAGQNNQNAPDRAAMGNSNSADHDSNQVGTDTWITTKVKADLATTSGVDSSDISVKTTNGVVTLTGVLPSNTQVDKAIATAKAIKGVTSVDSSGLKVND